MVLVQIARRIQEPGFYSPLGSQFRGSIQLGILGWYTVDMVDSHKPGRKEGSRGIAIRLPVQAKHYIFSAVSSSAPKPTQPPIQWIEQIIIQGWNRRRVNLTIHSHLMPRLGTRRTIPHFPLSLCGVQSDNFPSIKCHENGWLVQNLKWTSTRIAWWPQARAALLSFREGNQTKKEGKKGKTSWANIVTANQQVRQYQTGWNVDVPSQTIICQAPSTQHTVLHCVSIRNETLSSTTGTCVTMHRQQMFLAILVAAAST